MATTLRDNQPIGFAESHDPARTRTASLNTDGSINFKLLGLAPRNEQDSDVVCTTLVNTMQAGGLQVDLRGRGEQDDDFILEIGGSNVGVQVVRALTAPHFWMEFARTGEVRELQLSVADAVFALRTAIEHKTRIPAEQRPTLILALDAYRLPALALGPVTSHFRQTQSDWVRSLGFYAVFVVGPEAVFVDRLDTMVSP